MLKIIYNSLASHTKEYALLLKEELGCEAYSLKEAKSQNLKKDDIIFMTWLRIGQPTKLKKVLKKYHVVALCTVGMTLDKLDQNDIIEKYKLEIPLYYLPGGFDINRLHGFYKFLMSGMQSNMNAKISNNEEMTDDERLCATTIVSGSYYVSKEHLDAIIRKFKEWEKE
ncbi:MAG: hypothetical protein ACI35W_06235 [Anaeroplasmataceae bacterium]